MFDVNGNPLFIRFSITSVPSAVLIKCLLNGRLYDEKYFLFISSINSMRHFPKKELLELKVVLIEE